MSNDRDSELIELVLRMREAQRRWFKKHDRADLTLSKKLEADVDKALADRFPDHGRLI